MTGPVTPPDLTWPPLWADLPAPKAPVPTATECAELMERYGVLLHIRDHCARVADLAAALATQAVERGLAEEPLVAETRAAGFLHDIAKTYSIRHGGSHAQIGASWVMAATGNPVLAHAVLHHVEWPWPLPPAGTDLLRPVFLVGYADKRVRHDVYVTLEERYTDLLARYGVSDAARASILSGRAQAFTLERALAAQLEVPLDACTVAGGRLVPRA